MRNKDAPNFMQLYNMLAHVLEAFEDADIKRPVAIVLPDTEALEQFKRHFSRDLFPPPVEAIEDGVHVGVKLGVFEIRVEK